MSEKVRTAFALALLFAVSVCLARGQQKPLTTDQAQVAGAVSAVFDAASHDDLVKFHSVVAPGFYLFDAGSRFDGDTIMALIKSEHAKGRKYEWTVTEPDVHVIGDTAWIAYVNQGSVTDASGTTGGLTALSAGERKQERLNTEPSAERSASATRLIVRAEARTYLKGKRKCGFMGWGGSGGG